VHAEIDVAKWIFDHQMFWGWNYLYAILMVERVRYTSDQFTPNTVISINAKDAAPQMTNASVSKEYPNCGTVIS
jgi:hypothetical protein